MSIAAPGYDEGMARVPQGESEPAAADRLERYRAKRDPAKTPEPFEAASDEATRPTFVIHRHDATRLHYDLRLEMNGALASWAVPKGLPLVVGEKHLAVHVEDHPLSYGAFEGTIPAGQYGAGTVEIWDSGVYEIVEHKKDGGITFALVGRHLEGVWTLVPAAMGGDDKNWLLLRKSGGREMVRREGPPYTPMLASTAQDVPTGDDWIYEVKWDGYRALATMEAGEATLTSRTGQDLTQRFKSVASALVRAIRTPECVLDGEVCALDATGRPSFQEMQRGGDTLRYVAFDCLEIEGASLVELPLVERRRLLGDLIAPHRGVILMSEAFPDGAALLAAAVENGMEGVMAKRAQSRYRPGARSPDWVKVKTSSRQEFVIAGYTHGTGSRARLGALVLAVQRDGAFQWAGNVGTGFTEAEIGRLLDLLRPLRTDISPFDPVPKMPRVAARDVQWVQPHLVCEVQFAEWTADERLRAPVFLGLRDDKPAAAVVRERPTTTELPLDGRNLAIRNLDKVFWPEEGITKGDLVDYYRAIAPAILPHLRDRPFTMRRYPDGVAGEAFFQKDAPKHMPEDIATFAAQATTRETPRRTRMIRYPVVNDAFSLMWMVSMGCIDMNPWYSRTDRPDRPDFVLFDLDPSDGVEFPAVVRVARLIKDVLDLLDLRGYPKTSGSKGIHIIVPIARRYTFSQTRHFAEVVAGALSRTHRELVTTEWRRDRRHGVLIDANQNGEGKTVASVYSVRPRPGAPVSTPLTWAEVTDTLDPAAFTMGAVLKRVEERGDLHADVLTDHQSLGQALRTLSSGDK
jgi:bifunctional non-homologous end joining protein LigD